MPGNLYKISITTRTPYKNKLVIPPPSPPIKGSCLSHVEKLGLPLAFSPQSKTLTTAHDTDVDKCPSHCNRDLAVCSRSWLTKSVKICAPHYLHSQAPRHHLPSSARKRYCPPSQRREARANSQLVSEDGCEKWHFFTHPHNRRSSSVTSGRSNHEKQIYRSAPNRMPESILPSSPVTINGKR